MTYAMSAFGRMNAAARKEALGLKPTAHLPGTAPATQAHGIDLMVVSHETAVTFGQSSNRPQRVVARCPVCLLWFSAGNLAQHHAVHTEAGRAALAAKAQRRKDRVAAAKARQVARKKAEEQGFDACNDGGSEADNPYRVDTQYSEYWGWIDGFRNCERGARS